MEIPKVFKEVQNIYTKFTVAEAAYKNLISSSNILPKINMYIHRYILLYVGAGLGIGIVFSLLLKSKFHDCKLDSVTKNCVV